MADGYERQIAPQRVSGALPFANPSDYGAGIGEMLSQVGGQQAQRNVRDKGIEAQREYDREALDAMARYAELQERVGLADNEARTNFAPGAAGHRDTITSLVEQEGKDFLGSIKNEKLREKYTARVAEYRATQTVNADAFERGESVKLMVGNWQKAVDTKRNALSRGASAGEYAAAINELRETLADPELGLSAAVRSALEIEGVESLTAGWLGGQSPEQTKALIASGDFDSFLSPEVLARLDANADVDIRRAQVEAEAKARAAAAQTKEAVDQFVREVNDGIPKPDEELAAMQAQAAAVGDEAAAYSLGKARVQNGLNRAYSAATPAQLDAEIKAYDARIAQARDKARPEDIIARDHLVGLLEKRTGQVRKDPLGFAAQNGIVIAPLDPADPATFAARAQAARATAKLTGQPAVYLTDEEADQWGANMTTAAGKLQVSAMLSQFGSGAQSAAAQVAPGDAVFVHSLGLGPQARKMVFDGQTAMSTKQVSVPAKDAQAVWNSGGVIATSALPANARAGIYQSAVAIYAAKAAATGTEEFDEAMFQRSIDTAAGATWRGGVKHGGMSRWGVAPFLLPSDMTANDYNARVRNIAKVQAYYGNGQQISAAEFRRQWRPVAVRDGVYEYRNGRNETLYGKDKRPFRLNIRSIEPIASKAPTTPKPVAGPVYRAPPRNPDIKGPVYAPAGLGDR